VEAAFIGIEALSRPLFGYMGGHFENPCYLNVLSRITRTRRVAQVGMTRWWYEALLDISLEPHDQQSEPTRDQGGQYRASVFCHTPEQELVARRSKEPGTLNKYDQSNRDPKFSPLQPTS